MTTTARIDRPEVPLPARQGQPWSDHEDQQLYASYAAGRSAEAISQSHSRTQGAIFARLRKLGMLDADGNRVEPLPPLTVALRIRDAARAVAQYRKPKRVFALQAPDGWEVEIISNRPLDAATAARLSAILQGSLAR
jgi:hypothetical protein